MCYTRPTLYSVILETTRPGNEAKVIHIGKIIISLLLQTVSDGYIALVLPRLQAADKIVAGLLSEDEYMNRLEIQ